MFEELTSGAAATVFTILLAVPIYLVAKKVVAGLQAKSRSDHLEMTSD